MADKSYIKYENLRIPLKIKKEWRRTVRYSISKKSINLTVPKFYTRDQIQKEFEKIRAWSHQQFRRSPDMVERFVPRTYTTGDSLSIYGEQFDLIINYKNRKTCSAEIMDQTVLINAPEDLDDHDRHKNIGNLLSRLFSKHFLPAITTRVMALNELHFQEQINRVSLKNNQSNWGSCSSNRNINLSSRLLFAPRDVIDYVIIHELAHLKEMNHSKRFWSIVEKAMPGYKTKDAWLTKNGYMLKF